MARQRAEATGQLHISLDAQGLEARASFTPGDGEVWTPDRLIEEMRAHGIVEGFRPDDTSRTFALVLQRGTTDPFVVARGIKPAEPQPERVRLLEIAIPSEMDGQAQKVLTAAAAPRITVEKKERIRKKKLITRKPKLPFLPPQQETTEYTEEVVRHERVYVDPTVEKTGYATTGRKIGMIEGRDDGEAGRSVTGDLIPTRVLADPFFYCGAGVERRRDELFAQYDGFVRIGSNWADIVPFETHDWELSLSDDRASIYLSFDPGHAHAHIPTPEEVRSEADRLEYPSERLLDEASISHLISQAVSSGEALRNEPLTQSRDASFALTVSEDKLQAVLSIYKGIGNGAPLRLREVGATIKQSRLVKLDYEKIRKEISAFYQSTDTEMTGYVLAEGTAPAPGPDRTIDFSVRFLPPDEAADLLRHLKERIDDDDFPAEAIEDIAPVELDQRVLTIAPAVPGRPGADVYGQQTPGQSAPEPPMQLHGNLERKGTIIIATAPGMLHRGWRDGTVLLRALAHRDGRVRVSVTENRMAALITMTPPEGTGRPLAWETVERAFREAGISSGIREEMLLRGWERVRDEREEIRDLIFARGKHIDAGGEGELEMLVGLASGKGMTLRADGRADFRNQDRITTVTKGTEIARVRPPSGDTSAGWDVLGARLQAEAGNSVQVDAGANVSETTEPDGARILTADIDGELIFDQKRFEIRAAHTVNGDVDLHSGNVKFPGTVTVKGSVRSGFYVVASGGIQIGELVEAALLSADGDIVVNQGVKGGGKAVLRTKGSVGVTFAEQTTILAVNNVQAKNSLVHCEVKTNGSVRMLGDKGSIVGGRIRARGGLETYNLGSERGVKTSVEFGQDYLIADRIESENREMETLKQEIARIDLAMREAERSGNRGVLDALHTRKLQMLKMLEKRGLRVFTYRERFEEHYESHILVKGILYPGVVIETHGRTMEITSERRNVIIRFSPETGRIEEHSAAKRPTEEA